MTLKQELIDRGYLHQYTHEEVFELFDKGGKNFYRGVDLSADSMTIGNFCAMMMVFRFMLKGNTAYLLVGGATSTIGNPSGKDKERPLLSEEQLQHNQSSIHAQFDYLCKNVSKISGKGLSYKIVNNKDFFEEMNVLEFLRDVGRSVTVNWMLSKDLVRKRVEDPDKRISYAEFSYMLIMGYDFYYLNQNEGVILQVGGSDERDGIMAGLEITQKKSGNTIYGVTNKLVTDSTGRKFGKSEGNAIWLDPSKNSPFVCYNYFINCADDDISRYLKLFTLLENTEIDEITKLHLEDTAQRNGQKRLAYEVVRIIYGESAAEDCLMINQTLYGSLDPVEAIKSFSKNQVSSITHALNGSFLSCPTRVLECLVCAGLFGSNSEAKKGVKNGLVSVNGNKITDIGFEVKNEHSLSHGFVLFKVGKKKYGAVVFSS